MAGIKLEVVTPTGKVLDAQVSAVTAPGSEGDFGVLPEHRPGLVMLGGGALTYEGSESGQVFIRGGVAEVRPDGLLVLADDATTPDNIDRDAAEKILQAAVEGLDKAEFLDDGRLQRFNSDRAYAEAILKVSGH